jgi:TorA maturation chaperone TorD
MLLATAAEAPAPRLEEVVPEDWARADFYALIGSLFYAAPDGALLASLANSQAFGREVDSPLARAWAALQAAAASADPADVNDEFDLAFVSTGNPPVPLAGCMYTAGFMHERPLAELRDDLARLGLARRTGSAETEDHVSALCDVMRLLIAGGDGVPPATGAAQREFFSRHLQPWYGRLCDAVRRAGQTRFYKPVADLAQAFFDVESAAFEIA